MPGESAFRLEGLVKERFANGTFSVELVNGHRLLGFLTGRAKLNAGTVNPGQKVRLQLSPYDLSQGRIVLD